MSTKVEPAVRTATSSAPASGSKISMFASKSGFVIPKNKLSGSLVPLYRGAKKGGQDIANEESSNKVQRKTKWGPDLKQDTAVRKGRALAYQTRLDQITQQLSSGILEMQGDHDLSNNEPAGLHLDNKKSKLLEIERHEVVGEILKLNPMYKAPADYKPLLKEAKVPILIKDYPGFNFINLIFGTAKDSQKRIEKETGAKLRVFGRKTDSRDEVEIPSSEGRESSAAYEELYVHVSADTYEKVDAAVALVELLTTPITVNTASGPTISTPASSENINAVDVGARTPGSHTSSDVNSRIAQSTVGSVAVGHFEQYPGSWLSPGSAQTPVLPSSGYMAPASPSAALLNSATQVSSAGFSNMPSLFGPRPILAAGFSSMPQNPPLHSLRPQLSPVMQGPYAPQGHPTSNSGIPRNPAMTGLQSAPTQQNITTPLQYSGNQPTSTTPSPLVRPVISSLHQFAPSATYSVGGSTDWSHPSFNMPSNMVSPISRPPTGSTRPLTPQSGILNSFSESSLNFNPAPRLQQPNMGDFTFQPRHPQHPVSHFVSRPGPQHGLQNMPSTSQMMHQPQAPQNMYLHPASHTSSSPPVVQVYPRPQVGHQTSELRMQSSVEFPGSSAGPPFPFRHPAFSNSNAVPPATVPQMQPRNFNLAPSIRNPSAMFPPRAGNPMGFPQTFPNQARNQLAPNPQFIDHISMRPILPNSGASGSGAQQVYDPFAPTSFSKNTQMSAHRGKVQGQESDPEYEDLMASVGVK